MPEPPAPARPVVSPGRPGYDVVQRPDSPMAETLRSLADAA